MPAKFSLKKLILFFFCGFVCVVAAAFGLNFLLEGPKLGKVYDFLIEQRTSFRPPPVSNEILIINTDNDEASLNTLTSTDVFNVLLTLTEMEAADLFLAEKIAGTSFTEAMPASGAETEIRVKFNEEYDLVGNNIRNLFEAIRVGSVPPAQAPFYVEKLVELSEQSRERLIGALFDKDEDLVRAAAVFGNFTEIDFYPIFDWDGKIRRVRPIETESSLEHPVFHKLKKRYASYEIKNTVQGNVLILRGFNGEEIEITLDREGNILTPGIPSGGFRNIDITLFREYEEACRIMRQIMKEADEAGAFSQTLPEKSPLFLEDYALKLREELLNAPDNEKRAAWIEARENYFSGIKDFLSGEAETLIVEGYEKIIEEEVVGSREETILNLIKMRDEIKNKFAVMEKSYNELTYIYDKLKENLESSFCVMGSSDNTEYSALLANSIITGSNIKPAYYLYVLYWTIGAAFLILLTIFRIRPFILLLTGFILSIFNAAAFGLSFILTAYWIDPVIAFGASFLGTLSIFSFKRASLRRRKRRFRAAYGASVSSDVLKKLINRGKPETTEVTVADVSVVAIRDFNLLKTEDREKIEEAGKAQREFYEAIKKIAFNKGGVITGYEGDTVIICFGSPFEVEDNSAAYFLIEPEERAYSFVKELLASDVPSWRFGIDSGKCAFSWTAEVGFKANGKPVVCAKILASKNMRLQTLALITASIREKTNLNLKKMGLLHKDTDAFYELA